MALALPQHFAKTVAVAGTAEALSSTPKLAVNIIITANSANTGSIYIGNSGVTSSDFLAVLLANQELSIELPLVSGNACEADLADLYINSSVSGEGVKVGYYSL